MSKSLANRVLRYWFRDFRYTHPVPVSCHTRWYQPTPQDDDHIRREFESDLLAFHEERTHGNEGPYSDLQNDPHGCLALTILTDRMTRSMFRGQPFAYALLDGAIMLSSYAFTNGYHDWMHPIERMFLVHPLLASEDLSKCELGVQQANGLIGEAEWYHREYLQSFCGYAEHHLQILEKYGRYPLRNKALGRHSTPEEQAFLDEYNSRFAQELSHQPASFGDLFDYEPSSASAPPGTSAWPQASNDVLEQERVLRGLLGKDADMLLGPDVDEDNIEDYVESDVVHNDDDWVEFDQEDEVSDFSDSDASDSSDSDEVGGGYEFLPNDK